MSAQPPRLAVALLRRWLPPTEQDEVIGDLEEEFAERAAGSSGAARRWFYRQTLHLILRRRALTPGAAIADANPPSGWLADLGTDVKLACRSMRRSPAFSAVVLLTLIVSLGTSTAVFSIIRSVLLKPLPFATADRVVRLGMTRSMFDSSTRLATVGGAPAPPELSDMMIGGWLSRPGSLEAIAAYSTTTDTVTLDGEAMRVNILQVGPAFFQILPSPAAAGRLLQPADADITAARTAVVSARLLAPRYAHVGSVIGTRMMIGAVPHDVVGVLPADFAWPDLTVDIWVSDRSRWPGPGAVRNMGRTATTIGLAKPGADAAAIQREGQRIADDLVAAGAALSYPGVPAPGITVAPLSDELLQPLRPALTLLVAGTIGVLIAANVNLAGFLISRNVVRRRDLAVRQALGAGPWRLIRPLLVEQALLATIGAAGALVLAHGLIRLLPVVAPRDLPRLSAIAIDGVAFGFALAAAAATVAIIGLLPARRLAATNLRVVVADGGAAMAGASRRSERLRRFMVTTQVGVAAALLIGTMLIGRSLVSMLRIDLGYDPRNVLTFQIGTSRSVAASEPGRITRFYATLLDRVRALPSVKSAGATNALPLHGDVTRSALIVPGLTPPRVPGVPWPTTHREYVDTTYLQTIGATLISGRFFTTGDREGAEEVAIVNDTFGRTFMPGVDPLGRVIPSGAHAYLVVGVVRSIQRAASTMAEDSTMYLPSAQLPELLAFAPSPPMGVAVRTSGSPMAIARDISAIVRELDPGAPVHNMLPLEERIGRTFAQPRFFAVALAIFASLSLATALMGVYGILASVVARRRVELGVRRALGATARDVGVLVLGEAARLAVVGLAGGIAIGATASAVGRARLYGISPIDLPSYVAAAVVVFLVVLVGAWVPMRAALRVDPARVLKTE